MSSVPWHDRSAESRVRQIKYTKLWKLAASKAVKAKMRASSAKWRKSHKEVCNAASKAYYYAHRSEMLARAKAWVRDNPIGVAAQKERARARRYGLTVKKLREFLKRRCEICGAKTGGRWGGLYVDHCHKRDVARGVLCGNCNSGLGFFKDDLKLLRSAVRYMRRAA